MRLVFVIVFIALVSCGKGRATQENATASIPREAAISRLMGMLDNGWVVSRWGDGRLRDQGDSLIFTGIALGALPCYEGGAPEKALLSMLEENHGGVYRHPSIPDDYSLDGLLGLWWGIDRRFKKCPEARSAWLEILPLHREAISVAPYFDVVLRTILSEEISEDERGKLGSEVAGWALAVVTHRAAAYRLHLGFLALSVVDAPKGKAAFCGAVKEAEIPLLDHFCGRAGLQDWAANFRYDQWVYRHQRASWESPDGKDGLSTPGLDYLIALDQLQ